MNAPAQNEPLIGDLNYKLLQGSENKVKGTLTDADVVSFNKFHPMQEQGGRLLQSRTHGNLYLIVGI